MDGVLASDIRSIDPNTIETISILKDAAAAGIYGAAGSTKQYCDDYHQTGFKGKPRVDVNFYTGYQQITKRLAF